MTQIENFHTLLSRLDDRFWRLILRKFMESRRNCFPGLTPREREVWDLYAHGMSVADIARCLTIEASTVRAHIKRVRSKLGLTGVRREQFKADDKDQGKGE